MYPGFRESCKNFNARIDLFGIQDTLLDIKIQIRQ